MLPLPYTHPLAAGMFWAVFALFTVSDLAVLLRGRHRNRAEPPALDRASRTIAIGAVAIALVAAFSLAAVFPAAAIATNTPVLRWALLLMGVALLGAGTVLRRWAMETLGRYFTHELRVDVSQPVIDSGPYRFIRHPSYTGALIAMLGVGLALCNWASLIVVISLPTMGFLRRIALEERTMAESLGEPYVQYAAKHRRLVPGIW